MAQNIGIVDYILGEGATNSLINATGAVLAEQQKTKQQQIVSQTSTNTATAELNAFIAKNQTAIYAGVGLILVVVALKIAKVI